MLDMSQRTTELIDFDFENLRDVSGTLHILQRSIEMSQPEKYKEDHLAPLLDFDMSRLSSQSSLPSQLRKSIIELGRCTHRLLAVLLLEPTTGSRSTIDWIDFFLKVTTKGHLTGANTAIVNARALVPNASFNKERFDSTKCVTFIHS